ncbi:MHC class II regulatory factor RFX1 isoform X1 [Etheostoma spectabile]|uniref:MHC class II regulatory factor RFX1 isoform X1 n=1 Tax=Etheostoma spectabile TaxID=54343 RepID=UPI0013AFCC9D|nr:MHC class II regulatory factor RFX1 isoform X1 [Etheostoma spectabile]XP_032394035.1 MHC class II regulatory factor RFX1 isoform X1 [Etheostoma spectabile]XP_032394044.1 MHC class II regulatory factor RFX1 isoform X1 [Etheostoma spectabile]XP_032394051.1 MHC class II regulatory factor RFX1 isoform X1 [Etheostoma spectabile]XP_032394060.1 MHC class II regulatory factor RFX1 isoform X1 [Etheostoma spectabile]
MATSGYSEDLQPQQANTVTIATPSPTTPSSAKTAHFLSEIPPTSGAIASANQSATVSKTGQDALCSQAPPINQKAVVLTTPTQHYVSQEIQHSAVQKSNGQSNSPQYIIVTVTEGSVHSNDSLSDSSPPATGVPTQVVQPVQTTQQRSVLQAVSQAAKRIQIKNLQSGDIHREVEHVYSGQVQYVDGGGDTTFTTSSIRSSNYPFSDSPLYSQTPSSSSSYYEATPSSESDITGSVTSQPVSVATAGANSGGAATGGGGYVIQGGYVLGGTAAGGGGQSYTSPNARAPPATVQWLCDNYEGAEGVSLPRCTLYYHYLLHCQEQKLEPVNAASFGKLIRSVFMGLRTRRLGTRGNSKYHYYGLRIKSGSPLLRLMDEQQHMAMRQQPFSQKNRIKPLQKSQGITNGTSGGMGQQQAAALCDISAQVQQYQQFLEASRPLPDFVDIDLQDGTLPDGILLEHLKAFQTLYREHCEAILDVMVNLQFTLVETLWKSFWRFSQSSDSESLNLHNESEKRLPKSCLVVLCKYEPVLRWTKECDNLLYQTLVEILIPDVLRPIPSALTQAIRNFAKSLENWLTGAMMNIPEEMVRIKVVCVGSFSQTLRRYTSLNHLAQAARAVLQNSAQINQMLSDLNRVDFTNVQEQASWVCQCEDRVVQRLEQDFKMTLQQQNSLEQWATWLEGVVSEALKPYEHNPIVLPKAAKVFLLNWSFYSSMVIRDLTLRSAASFGSFHLIRLLYDEYMYYLIEHRVAQAKGVTPIAVMGEFASTVKSRISPDLEKEEEEDDEEEESEDEGGDLVLQSSSLRAVDDEKDTMEPPAKLSRTSFNLHSLTDSTPS